MQKGQISIDLLFSVLAAILIVLSFNGLINSSYLSQDKINTKQQLELENEKITNLITQTQMIDNSVYRINLTFEKISYLDENKIQIKGYPDALIQGNLLTLSINTGKEKIESTKSFSKGLNTNIIIGTEDTKGSIVITNEQ